MGINKVHYRLYKCGKFLVCGLSIFSVIILQNWNIANADNSKYSLSVFNQGEDAKKSVTEGMNTSDNSTQKTANDGANTPDSSTQKTVTEAVNTSDSSTQKNGK